jgi:hypothetical protein
LTESKKTKRKVDLVSAHSDRESEDGQLSAVSELYKDDRIPAALRYLPKAGETVVYEEIFIPDENRLVWQFFFLCGPNGC